MLLALNIGNTNIKLGVFNDGQNAGPHPPLATWRLATDAARMPDDYGLLLSRLLPLKGISLSDIKAVALCSVVPPLVPTLATMCREYLRVEPLVVTAGVKTDMPILYDNPRDIGPDRIVDAVAGLRLYGAPVVTVDLGTAAVFNAVSRNGEFVGGAIAPGIAIAADALFYRASMLRRVELARPPAAIGRNTVHAMQSGLVLGYAEMVKGMVARFDKDLGGGSKVVATGGLAGIIEKEVSVFDAVNPDLTLMGLQVLHQLNS